MGDYRIDTTALDVHNSDMAHGASKEIGNWIVDEVFEKDRAGGDIAFGRVSHSIVLFEFHLIFQNRRSNS